MFEKIAERLGVSEEEDEKPSLEEVGCVDGHRAIHGEMEAEE